jgi:chromosome partitioning protein
MYMRVISIICQKGGAGKTTFAIHIAGMAAISGYVPCIIDLDEQATAKAWSDWRKKKQGLLVPEVITVPHSRLAETLADAEALGADLIVIDTPPNADAPAVKAAKAADLILIPCRPQVFDLHAMITTADLINIARKPAWAVINGAHPQAQGAITDAREFIRKATECGVRTASPVITDRVLYKRAPETGKLVFEIEPIGAAARELDLLWTFIASELQIPASKQENAA